MKMRLLTLMMAVTMLSCCNNEIDHYKGTEPKFDVKEYFNGPIKAYGVVQDWRGRVVTKFDVDMKASWDGDKGILEEDFKYYDGRTQQRTWHITKLSENKYVGRADDVIGDAPGIQSGSAMSWAYTIDLKLDNGKTHRVQFDDWMWLMNDGVLVNRSYIKKFGIKVAELTILMQKQK